MDHVSLEDLRKAFADAVVRRDEAHARLVEANQYELKQRKLYAQACTDLNALHAAGLLIGGAFAAQAEALWKELRDASVGK